jgi:enolase
MVLRLWNFDKARALKSQKLIEHLVFGYVTVCQVLRGIIKKKYGQYACNVGDEGGFVPNIQDN